MIKNYLLAVLACLGLYLPALGQGFSIGIRGGISVPDLGAPASAQNPLNSGYKSRLGPDFGALVGYQVSKLFSLEGLVEYSSQGGKKDGMQAFPTPAQIAQQYPEGTAPKYVYANYNSEAELNYLMIPILAKFGFNPGGTSPIRIYGDAGPFLGILLSAKQVTSGSSMIYADQAGTQPLSPSPQSFNNNSNIKSQLNTVNIGIDANVGVAYQFSKNEIFLEAGGNYGFLNIQKGTQNGENTTGAATLLVGYSCSFGK